MQGTTTVPHLVPVMCSRHIQTENLEDLVGLLRLAQGSRCGQLCATADATASLKVDHWTHESCTPSIIRSTVVPESGVKHQISLDRPSSDRLRNSKKTTNERIFPFL